MCAVTPAHTRVVQRGGRLVVAEPGEGGGVRYRKVRKAQGLDNPALESRLPLSKEVHEEISTELAVLRMRSPQAHTRTQEHVVGSVVLEGRSPPFSPKRTD